jgi:predicted RNA-binding protein
LLENVAQVTVEGSRIALTTILEERREFEARIARVDFVESRLWLDEA